MTPSWFNGFKRLPLLQLKPRPVNLVKTGPKPGCSLLTGRKFSQSPSHSCPHAFGEHQQITGVRLADGTFFSRLTAEYPEELADALATVIAPFVTRGKGLSCLPNCNGLSPNTV